MEHSCRGQQHSCCVALKSITFIYSSSMPRSVVRGRGQSVTSTRYGSGSLYLSLADDRNSGTPKGSQQSKVAAGDEQLNETRSVLLLLTSIRAVIDVYISPVNTRMLRIPAGPLAPPSSSHRSRQSHTRPGGLTVLAA